MAFNPSSIVQRIAYAQTRKSCEITIVRAKCRPMLDRRRRAVCIGNERRTNLRDNSQLDERRTMTLRCRE